MKHRLHGAPEVNLHWAPPADLRLRNKPLFALTPKDCVKLFAAYQVSILVVQTTAGFVEGWRRAAKRDKFEETETK